MVNMVAAKRVKYPHGPTGREYAPGEPFTALSERDAKGLFISGKAKYGTADVPSLVDLPREVMTRQVKAEGATETPEVNADAGEPKPKGRRYKRRDLQAEE